MTLSYHIIASYIEMPGGAPPSNVDQFRDEIVTSYEAGAPVTTIFNSITEKGCKCSERTLNRRMKSWGLTGHRQRQLSSDEVMTRIRFLFVEQGYTDEAIQQDLSGAGVSISTRTIKRTRIRHGMKRRYRNVEERKQAKQRACNQCRRRKVCVPQTPCYQ